MFIYLAGDNQININNNNNNNCVSRNVFLHLSIHLYSFNNHMKNLKC